MKKTVAKYSKFCATVQPILLAFPSSYMVESGLTNVYYLLSQKRSTLNREHYYLQLKLINLKLNIIDLLNALQTHPSH